MHKIVLTSTALFFTASVLAAPQPDIAKPACPTKQAITLQQRLKATAPYLLGSWALANLPYCDFNSAWHIPFTKAILSFSHMPIMPDPSFQFSMKNNGNTLFNFSNRPDGSNYAAVDVTVKAIAPYYAHASHFAALYCFYKATQAFLHPLEHQQPSKRC